jgi:serine/threonine protein kinase/Flp pilus assembly protein TadD
MGVVYHAHDTRLDRTVALKFLPPHLDSDEAAMARFIHEAKAASALDHTNICTIHDIVESEEGQLFIVMVYYDGETLNKKIARGPLPVDEALDYSRQIARGLAKAHGAGIVHRDVKPANLLVTTDGVVKILDFGIAKVAGVNLTVTGVPVGTVAYMSPEQARGGAVDHRTDIWALGVVLYELLTGKHPFNGDYPQAIIYSVLNEEPKPIGVLRPDLPPALERAVNKALAKNPDERYQNFEDFLADLTLSPANVQRAAPPHPSVVSRSTVPGRPIVYGAAGLLLVILLVALGERYYFGERLSSFVGLSSSAQAIGSIVVLPPQNLSQSDDQEYFVAGMHDALISALARIGKLRVISRTSAMRYRDSDKTVPEIARELNVDGLVEASVYRDGSDVHVQVRLIRAHPEERQLWTQAFEREFENVPEMHGDMAQAIARQIQVTLSPEEEALLTSARPVNGEAYEAYLRGMFHLNKSTPEDFQRGLAYLHEAVENDPADALAYSGLALGYVTLGHGPAPPPDAWMRAREAAERAVRLDSTLAEAWAALADVKTYFEWDWDGAEDAFQRANALNPNLAMNHYHYAWYLILFGRVEEALAEHRRAQELDPLTPLHTVWLPGVYLYTGHYARALDEARRTAEQYPENATALYVLGTSAAQMGEFDEAIAAHEKMVEVNPRWKSALGRTYAVAGRTEDARRILAELEAQPPTSWGAIGLADLHTALGNKDEAFRWLAYEPAHGWLPWSRANPALEPLRDDPRFHDLMRHLGLPE